MKHLRSCGLGSKKQAEPISIHEETILWEHGLLGSCSPQVLLDTMVFLCGMYFALRSGQEHRDLQFSQIELIEPSGNSPPYLVYTENISKNNTGGMAQRKLQPKQVMRHSNTSNQSRCFVHLFKEYVQHCPKERKTTCFYLTALKKPKGDVWYSDTPVGHNTLSKTVKRLCASAGISGFKTTHSLRVTNATRLFQSGVDEQLIMARTGHRSVEGVRSYKRISHEQRQTLSEVLNSATNGNEEPNTEVKKPRIEELQKSVDISIANGQAGYSSSSMLPSMNFSGCSQITINYSPYTPQ